MSDPVDLGPIIVTGKRHYKPIDIPYDRPDEPAQEDGTSVGGGAVEIEIQVENDRQRDCAAQKAKAAILSKTTRNLYEFLNFIVEKGGDTITHSNPIGGTSSVFTNSQLNAVLGALGVGQNQVKGIVHNHTKDDYCNAGPDSLLATRFNQYPSENDWAYAYDLVGAGANPSDLTLYIIGCDDVMRSFGYYEMLALRPLVQNNYMTAPTTPLPPILPAAPTPVCP